MTQPDKTRERLFYVAVFVVSLLILFSRRPDAFTNPQFWAEDGKQWFEQAYNDDAIRSIFKPESGYFQTSSRLVAAAAQLFPLAWAPAVFNAAAIAVKIGVVLFLCSGRLAKVLPGRPAQLLAAFLYLAMPHSYEVHANLTNAMWHLALLAGLILTASPPLGSAGRFFDYAVIALSALSGPFCIFLAPLAAVKVWRETDPPARAHTRILLFILAAGLLIQVSAILLTPRGAHASLGATGELFFKIVGGHWFINAVGGEVGLTWLIRKQFWNLGLALLITASGLGVLLYALLKAKDELRLLILFSAMLVGAAMASPLITSRVPQWSMMWLPGIGGRYWLIPIFTFLLTLQWLARRAPSRVLRTVAVVLLLLCSIGVVTSWRYPAYKDLAFPQHAAAFENAAPGEEVAFPINPDWEMRLKKK